MPLTLLVRRGSPSSGLANASGSEGGLQQLGWGCRGGQEAVGGAWSLGNGQRLAKRTFSGYSKEYSSKLLTVDTTSEEAEKKAALQHSSLAWQGAARCRVFISWKTCVGEPRSAPVPAFVLHSVNRVLFREINTARALYRGAERKWPRSHNTQQSLGSNGSPQCGDSGKSKEDRVGA
ncbi:hypothetical protein FA13DRAFT_1776250 [Coprinellus micaceus]|uniref:Uncharacterized protein n=1 Tax=Coprinellus micaceus TaxID=71717 RepID=A0A4Y7T322_COPMI|nr:hypothetical protein FA13DRAFT_1776250 [Coprinellus micaceus]